MKRTDGRYRSFTERFIKNDTQMKMLLAFFSMDRDPDQLAKIFSVSEPAMLRILKNAKIEPGRNKKISPVMSNTINIVIGQIALGTEIDFADAVNNLRDIYEEEVGVDLFEQDDYEEDEYEPYDYKFDCDNEEAYKEECVYAANLALCCKENVLKSTTGKVFQIIQLDDEGNPCRVYIPGFEEDYDSFKFDEIATEAADLFEGYIATFEEEDTSGAKFISNHFGTIQVNQFTSMEEYEEKATKFDL